MQMFMIFSWRLHTKDPERIKVTAFFGDNYMPHTTFDVSVSSLLCPQTNAREFYYHQSIL